MINAVLRWSGQNPKKAAGLTILVCFGLTFFSGMIFLRVVDLRPKVEGSFFFSEKDPQYRADLLISKIFPQPLQVIIGVKGDLHAPEYLEKIKAISNELESLPEVSGVQSLTKGPKNLQDAETSPLWRRILFATDGQSSFISIFIKNGETQTAVEKIEKIKEKFQRQGTKIMIAGGPYATELIARNLLRDLELFSGAALVIFGIVLLIIFRSFTVLLGTLIACLNSSALTLIAAHFMHIPIGPLTANLSTMVFVLTLSPIVFLTFNWKKILLKKANTGLAAVWEAVKVTAFPSFWSMSTTFIGFGSLLFVKAEPMRQLGLSGAVGAIIAFLSAYIFYPWFLPLAEKTAGVTHSKGDLDLKFKAFFSHKHGRLAAGMILLTLLASIGMRHINTDPDLVSYFKKGSELRSGLEYVDTHGGSSPIKMVVSDCGKEPFNTEKAYQRLQALNEALEKAPAVGNVVSLPVVLAEGRRSPMSFLISTKWLLKIMESPKFGQIAKYFVSEDRSQAFFVLMMQESGRLMPREKIIESVREILSNQGFNADIIGGAYVLQSKLSELVGSSLIEGIILLLILFVAMVWMLSKSIQVAAALLVSLVVIPVSILGLVGFLKIPIDVISAPAVNLAIGIGVDAMIYMSVFARRSNAGKINSWKVWAQVCGELWRPIGTSLLVVCSGFGIFMLSQFPPTQRFGFFVICGSLAAASSAILIFPWLASLSRTKAEA